MKKTLQTVMKNSISEVFETMFFMPLEFSNQLPDQGFLDQFVKKAGGNPLVCRLDFRGKLSGYILLMVPDDLLFKLTQDFLGQDEENLSANHLNGTLKEITNMIAGNTFSHLDDQAVIDLGIPEIIDVHQLPKIGKVKTHEEILFLIQAMDGEMAIRMATEA